MRVSLQPLAKALAFARSLSARIGTRVCKLFTRHLRPFANRPQTTSMLSIRTQCCGRYGASKILPT